MNKTRFAGRGDRSRSAVGWAEARGPRRGSRQTHRAKRPCPQLRRLRLELLEDRRLLDGAIGQQAIELFSVSPALFVENQGQWADESVRFLHQGDGVNVAMTDAGPVFQLFQREAAEDTEEGWLGSSAASPQGPSLELTTAPTGASLRSATSHPDDDSYESAGGVFSYSQQFAFTPDDASLYLYTKGGEVRLVSLQFSEVARTWP